MLAGFRYGRDDLDVLGLNFRRDLIDVSTGTCSRVVLVSHLLATKIFRYSQLPVIRGVWVSWVGQ